MIKAGQECPLKPIEPNQEVLKLRLKLIAEEFIELARAFGMNVWITPRVHETTIEINGNGLPFDLIEAVDATADLKVVVIGTDVAMGVDGEPCFEAVHQSNMSKFIDGSRRADGKWQKGKSWTPPNLKPILEKQSQ